MVFRRVAAATRVASFASIGALLVILVAMAMWSWHAAQRDAEIEISDSARALEAHMQRVLEVGDLLLFLQQEMALTLNRSDPGAMARANERLRRIGQSAPYVFRLFMADAKGEVYASSMTHMPALDVRGRDYFPYHQSGEHGLHISSVLQSQATGEAIIILSRRVTMPDGGFGGVVLVSFQLDILRDYAQSLLRGARPSEFQVIGPSMQVILDGLLDQDRKGIEVQPDIQHLFRTVAAGTWTYTASADVERLWTHRRVANYPVYVRVGVETAEIASRWAAATLPYAALSLLVLGVLIGLSWLGIRNAEAAGLAHRELDYTNRQLEQRVHERTTELKASNEALRASEAQLKLILEAARLGTYDRDLRQDRGYMSARGLELHGLPPGQHDYTVESFIAMVHPLDRPTIQAALKKAFDRQAPYDVEYRVKHPDGHIRWVAARGEVLFGADGRPERVAGISYDITERNAAEQRLKLLAREVDHRARNLLAVVQAMVRLTRADTIKEFIDSVEGRISAMGRAHTLLAENRWSGADMRRIIDREMQAYKGELEARVSVCGPSVMINPHAAQSIAMAVHELATNAMKYGALSVPEGRASLEWFWAADGRLVIRWEERGGPPVKPPTRVGFGTRVIKGTIQKQLHGELRMDWREEGLRCEFLLPPSAIGEMPPEKFELGASSEVA